MNDETRSLWRRFLRLGVDYPRACLFILLALSTAAAVGLGRLSLDTGVTRLAPHDEALRQAYLQVAREFGSDRRAFVYLRDAALWTPDKLHALQQVRQELRALPFVERVDDIFSSPAVDNVDGQLVAQPLLEEVPADDLIAEKERADALTDPVARRNLVSEDGRSLLIGLVLREGTGSLAGDKAFDGIEGVLARGRSQLPTLEQIGPPRIEAEIRQRMVYDFALLTPVTVLAVALVAFAFSRRLLAAALAPLIGAISALWVFGAMGFLGIAPGPLFVLLPPLVIGIGACEIVRLAAGGDIFRDRGAANSDPAPSPGAPTMLTFVALAFGLAISAFTGIGALRDFGFAAAAAVLVSGLLTILLLPRFSKALRAGARPVGQGPLPRPLSAARGFWSAHFLDLAHGRFTYGVLFFVTISLLAAALTGLNLRATQEPMALFRGGSAVVQLAERLRMELAGSQVFYITLDANTEGAFRDPVNLRRLADIQAFIARQHVFDRSLSLADIVAQANREAGGGRDSAFQVPAMRNLVSQYLLLHRPADLAPYVSSDFRRANIVVRHSVRDSSQFNHHVNELRQMAAHLAGAGMTTGVFGEGVLVNAATADMIRGQLAMTGLLLAFVLLAMALMFTSLRGGLVALAPALVTVAAMLNVLRMLDASINMTTGVLAVVAIVGAVQAASHLLARYSALCRNAADYESAVLDAVEGEWAPMFACAAVLGAAFAVPMLSDVAPVAEFGVLAVVAMLVAVVSVILFTPVLMSHLRLVGLHEILAMSMPPGALENSPLFHGFTNYQIRKTILISELREYRDGECLIAQGTVGRSMYLVVGGRIEVVRSDDGGGAAQRLATLLPGDVFGEIGFVHETYRTASVRALGPVSVLCFDHDRLKKDLALFPHIMAKLNFNISGILGKRLAEVVAGQHPH